MAVIVMVVILAGIAGVFFWRQGNGPGAGTVTGPGMAVPLQRPDEPLTVTQYLPENGILAPGTGSVKRQPEIQAQAREVLAGLFTGQQAAPPILKDALVRGFFLDPEGTAYVDLAAVSEGGMRASAMEELLAVYAVVNTLMENFEEIKQVRFLLDGREAQALAGHIDLSRSFARRLDLVRQ
ncbi:MAG: hypothetical protein A2010_11775 [Nitrospirae bacterium GWD2_57_9]|nr:MAG: hypothetical protein A2010_11775 [Nitrospirae bacterium GWD2_57_9]OGW48146.1 MAG: hypothetical protein A2078_01080 [Nitrospirae bacterium GWC2_57_9]